MAVFLAIVGTVVFYMILFYVIKAAVREGIMEARNIESSSNNAESNEDQISQTICPNCGKAHDMDFPKCPYCKYRY